MSLTTELFGLDGEMWLAASRNKSFRYPCPNQCGKMYIQRGSLTQHLKWECGKEPQFSCTMCFKKFSLRSNLQRHITLVHRLFF